VIRDLLRHHQVSLRREKATVERLRRKDHLVVEVILLFDLVVGLQSGASNLHGIREDLLAILDLLHLVADGLFLMFDLDDGMARLRRIEHNAGAELCVGDAR